MSKEFVDKLQINRGLQFPETNENLNGFMPNLNNENSRNNEANLVNSRGFRGLDNNIRPFNDVSSHNFHSTQSTNENLIHQVFIEIKNQI